MTAWRAIRGQPHAAATLPPIDVSWDVADREAEAAYAMQMVPGRKVVELPHWL
jgi:hypothetical protein